MEVKVLSVKNPFAYLIMQGGKDIENRTWKTDYRGRLYIHVSGETLPFFTIDENPPQFLKINNEKQILQKYKNYAEKLEDYYCDLAKQYVNAGVPTGSESEDEWLNKIIDRPDLWLLKSQTIIGYVDLVDIVQDSNSPWAIEGQYHWILKNPTLLAEPIQQVKGRLNIWNYNISE
ncbi:ASCH domain-containing protein [Treponema phagedenis]|uniref:ASCH domain-containing protein n=1 Tax=Treponema phagedenis TaxID=162 RepID=UPI000464EDC9|nr:ASCH domain-containing protein [Treponema phagedenis]NVP23250.1 ASCH domain-containing protein [Treponema phagedenis]QKS92578.1 ASCH domain-containing protein [Treponema phagedenis]QLC58111.1 ASCH domain-containing protein [Treponema phagedenis]QSH93625.1 ASCH domain-containing protein [Treponema phagedenis]